ncbi:MAG TPA: PQQ-binding-like beta-propeller repeat protein, partial [Pirellulales bacterium]|nr:PQQ-binding-like beta-propeller repeat protein [Pirellulales bacterium]
MQRVLYLFTVVSLVGILGCVENQAQTSQNPAKADKGSTTTVGSGADQQSDDSATTVAVADSEKPKSPAADQADDLPPPKLDLRITGETPVAEAQKIANEKGRADDWNQWGGSSLRNNAITVAAPTEWEVGEFNDETGEWKKETAENIKWAAALGSQTYGNVVVAGGKAFIGTNNGAGYLKRYPADVDLGVLVCFDSRDGAFLWQDSSEKLHTGRVHDWPLLGVCSSPSVEGDRVYYVTNRGELKCLDAEGFADGENDGPITNEKELAQKNTPMGEWEEKREA